MLIVSKIHREKLAVIWL